MPIMKDKVRTCKLRMMRDELKRPVICAPIVADEEKAIAEAMQNICNESVDITEWRIDKYCYRKDKKQVVGVLKMLREQFYNMPLICTFRTANEGGEPIEDEKYYELIRYIADSKFTDYIDIEINRGSVQDVCELIEYVHNTGIEVIASCHYFEHTPDKEEMLGVMRRMSEAGADVLKLAVMPRNRRDVLRLLEVTMDADDIFCEPVITMSMGKLGVVSRAAGDLTGSVMTFAGVGEISAPGQIAVGEMLNILNSFAENN